MSIQNNYVKYDNRPIRSFDNAEEAWLWFCFCESSPKSKDSSSHTWMRPCETSDIAIVIKRLVQQKTLTQQHLKVLSFYGLKQIPPHEKSGDSERVCILWRQALQRILEPLRLKGIVQNYNSEALG